jgi:hypothetical protein
MLTNVSVGVASSTKSNSRQAGQEAASAALERAGGASLGFVFFSAKRDADEVAKGVEDVFENRPFMGHASYFQITSEGFFFDSVSVLAINSPHIKLGIGIGPDVHSDPRGAGRIAIIEALKSLRLDAFPTQFASIREVVGTMKFNPLTCLMFTSRPYEKSGIAEEGIIQGITDVTGSRFEIAGSSAVGVDPLSKSIIQPLHVIANGRTYTNSVACGILASNTRLGVAMGHGFTPTTKTATIGRASGNIVYEINGKPALKGYAELLNITGDQLRDYFAVAPFLRRGEPNRFALGLMDVRGEY